ncbi:MAG: tetratricopeptide repeat protein, partial [Candidatus Omnitrophica bacterium]|nr:tetratricopeptide repeat protein [Candidatus Omnitrophota bacterium]
MNFSDKIKFALFINVLKRNYILYLALFLFIFIFIDNKTEFNNAKLDTLNRSMLYGNNHLIKDISRLTNEDKVQFQRSLDYYERIIEFMPNKPEAYGMAGFCSYILGNKEKAIGYYKRAIELNPNFFYFYHNLGIIYFNEGSYEKAVWALNKAIQTNPPLSLQFILYSPRIYMPIINLYKNDMNPAFQLKAAYQENYQLLGSSYLKLKKYPDVIQIASSALKAGPNSTSFYNYLLGVAAYELKEYDKALVFLKNSIEENPENADAYYYLGSILHQKGNTEQG